MRCVCILSNCPLCACLVYSSGHDNMPPCCRMSVECLQILMPVDDETSALQSAAATHPWSELSCALSQRAKRANEGRGNWHYPQGEPDLEEQKQKSVRWRPTCRPLCLCPAA